MKQIILSAVALLLLAGCGLTITPDPCEYDETYWNGECVDFDRGDANKTPAPAPEPEPEPEPEPKQFYEDSPS